MGTYLDIISVSEASELLLPGGVPDVEPDGSSVGVEHEGMDLEGTQLELNKIFGFISGLTSTPSVATYFFSNSPVRCRLTKVVLPVPPSPTRTNLKVGISSPVAMMRELVNFKSVK